MFLVVAFVSSRSSADTVPPPLINSFSPTNGPAGTTVTVLGENLGGATSVTFGSVSAAFMVVDSHELTVTVPTGAISGPFTVVTSGGSTVTSESFFVVATQPPQVTAFTPENGPVATEVTITGQFLSGTSSVLFNGLSAEFHEGLSGTTLVAVVPDKATTGPITVTTPAGTASSTASFTVTPTPPPTITGFSPESGPVGTRVVISGENLVGASAVVFNGSPASFSLFGNDITATVPDNATTGPITVVTPGGTVTSAEAFTITVENGPVITDVDPLAGRPGSPVKITGQNLNDANSVTFNGVAVAAFQVLGDTIFTTVPATATTGLIVVGTPRGSASSASPFTVIDPLAPEISSFQPNNGPPGSEVTIHGTNLNGVVEVRFASTSAGFDVISGDELRARVPTGASTGPITVIGSGGSFVTPELFYLPAEIVGFDPSHGAVGTSVTITGVNFTGASRLVFGDMEAGFTNVSATEIQAIVPAGAVNGPISITTPAGVVQSGPEFFLPPGILEFNPASGLPGTEITVVGENLSGASRVRFGGMDASLKAISLTNITVTVPPVANSGPITVTTPGGETSSVEPFYIGLFSDLALGLSVVPETVSVGDFLSYTLAVTNRGALAASGISVTDHLPQGISLLVPPSGADCVQTNDIITCRISDLAADASVAIRVVAMVDQAVYLTNQVTLTGTEADPNLANNTASLVTIVTGAPTPPTPTNFAVTASAKAGNSIELSWPAAAEGFLLETTPSLVPPIIWRTVDTPAETVDGQRIVREPTSSGGQFYRLRKPQ